ncbi:MAG TPA: hypothetical protein VH325_08605, partial [Bryobacteraceae bacterium]|nr:hypothetical protein [Bryobacteraceae bacterium]
HLSMLGFSGTGNLARVTSPTLTSPTLTSPTLTAPVIGGAENWLFTVGAGGVTASTLCKTDTSFNIVAVTTSDSGAYGVCPTTAVSGTTNYAVARYGQQAVLADGSTTIGDMAAISTTNAGYVHDLGQTASSNVPVTQRIIGVFKTAAAASGQTAIVDLTPAHFGSGTTLSGAGQGYVAPFGDIAYQAAGVTFTAGDSEAWEFVCCTTGVSITVNTIGIPIFTPQASSNVAAAIYTGPLSPATLRASTNGCASTSGGPVFCSLTSPYTLTEGTIYWVVISTDTANLTLAEEASTQLSLQLMLNQALNARQGKCANSVTWTSGVPTWPSSCTGTGLSNVGAHRSPQIVFLP